MTTVELTEQARVGYRAVLDEATAAHEMRLLRANGDARRLAREVRVSAAENLAFEPARVVHARLQRWQKLANLRRILHRDGYDTDLVGVFGPLENPEVLCSLQRNVLQYAYGVTFRMTDSPLRSGLKRCLAAMPEALIWSGPLILRVRSSPSAETATSSALTLLSADRHVSFLFRKAERWPYAVRKAGAADDLAQELANHRRAEQLLGDKVPALLADDTATANASFTLEYIPEFTLTNRVAQCLWGREQAFIREAAGLLSFCVEVYRCFCSASPAEARRVTEAELAELHYDLGALLTGCANAAAIVATLERTVGLSVPRVIQHGDFCVRNVLLDHDRCRHVLIDWEDLQDKRYPLVDYGLLRFSLRKVAATCYPGNWESLLTEPLQAAETALAEILGLERDVMRTVELLSLACLCRQNLRKGRTDTAQEIFTELKNRVGDRSCATEGGER